MKPLIKITDNSLHTLIDDSDTTYILLCNLTDLNERVVAEVWWSATDKNLYLITEITLSTYLYKGKYSLNDSSEEIFGKIVYDVGASSKLLFNEHLPFRDVNFSQITNNATLTLEDDTCVSFDAIVIRVNQKSWQCMLKADAVTKFVKINENKYEE